MPYLNCLPFPNRNSDSGDLYIVFKRFHLTFPMAHLDFQVEARFFHSFANHAYASHTASHISYHVLVLVVYYVVCFFSGVCFFGLVPITSRLWGPVRLHPFIFVMDSFFFLARFQARWSYPWNHFYLCLLVVRSINMSRYLPLVISCLPYCHVKPLTHLPSKPLFGYVTAFAQPLL